MIRIENDQLSVELAALGAEIRSIRSPDGAEWLWQGDPAWWTGRSPLLFPVVGRSPDNTVSVGGATYPMPPHGFARTLDFHIAAAERAEVRFTLEASDETLTHFPFRFRLELTYRLDCDVLRVSAVVTNLDRSSMPFQFGFHPGFVWPLPGASGQSHSIILRNGGEPACSRINDDKLLRRIRFRSPFQGGRLVPESAMFEDDAMLFLDGAGDHIEFAAEAGAHVEMRTYNLPQFALWQKPGAPYLCLEPWQGTTPFEDAGDALETRNGAAQLAPGAQKRFGMDLAFSPARSASEIPQRP